MLPRFSASGHHSVSHSVLSRQARVATHTNSRSTHSRQQAVRVNNKLVLTPIGNGKWEHIGDKVPLPEAIPLKDGVYEVGRSEPADIVLNIPTVSGRHALLRVEDDRILITDLNSTNGTVVDGQELSPMDDATVTVGSEVIFGDMYLARFEVRKVPDELLSEGSGAAGVMSSNMAAGPVDTMDAQPSSPSQAAAHMQQQQQQQEQQQPVAELQQKWQYLALGY